MFTPDFAGLAPCGVRAERFAHCAPYGTLPPSGPRTTNRPRAAIGDPRTPRLTAERDQFTGLLIRISGTDG